MPAETRYRWLRLILALAGAWVVVLVGLGLLLRVPDGEARAWVPFLAVAYISAGLGLTAIGKRIARSERERREALGEPRPSAIDRVQARRSVRNLNARMALGPATCFVLALVAGAATWIVAAIGVALLVVLLDVAWLTYTLRRDQNATA